MMDHDRRTKYENEVHALRSLKQDDLRRSIHVLKHIGKHLYSAFELADFVRQLLQRYLQSSARLVMIFLGLGRFLLRKERIS